MPSFDFEKKQNFALIAGIDEAGRGPFAGPVSAAAVVFPNLEVSDHLKKSLDDSKKLSPAKRESLFKDIYASNALIGVGLASVEEIDSLNILQATFLAMERAVNDLPKMPDIAFIDGNRLPKKFPCPTEAIIDGDALSLSIAAASIIAKVTRDRIMIELSKEYPAYGWEANAGYGTKTHREALEKYGITPHHRKSYAPIRKFLK